MTTMEKALNKSQKKFCRMPSKKNIRLLAPAGAGKTYSLLWRCRYLTDEAAKKGEEEPNFLIISFTRSAKLELEARMQNETEFHGIQATVRTLNSWGWEMIKRPGKELLLNNGQKVSLVKHDLSPVLEKYSKIKAAVKLRGKNQNASEIIDLIDRFKELGFTHLMKKTEYKAQVKVLKELGLNSVLNESYDFLYRIEGIQEETDKIKEERVWDFFEFWKKAVVYLDSVKRYTFVDQKYWARILLEKQIEENLYSDEKSRYTHIMVDEFQDINPLDIALLKAASVYNGFKGKKTPVTIVGDDDQAIFGWRGSSPKYILHPNEYFGVDFTSCVLDINYRSPKNIVEISNQLLSYNKEREPKEMRSMAKGRAYIKVIRSKKVVTSIEATMKLVKSLLNDDRFNSIALIGRRQTTLFPYQVLLGTDKIPYYVDYDLDILEGEAMQSLLSIIKTVHRSKRDDVDDPENSLITILDKIGRYGLNDKERTSLSDYLYQYKGLSFLDIVEKIKDYPGTIKKNLTGQDAFASIQDLINSETVYNFMEKIVYGFEGFDKDYTKKETDIQYKEPQFFRLKEISKRYGDDFKSFYQDLDLAKATVARSRILDKKETLQSYNEIVKTKVHLMTATRSKGHEYDAVIILDADDAVWPDRLADDIEEERRLFYVALSRARKNLYFVVSDDRLESRFLLETRLI